MRIVFMGNAAFGCPALQALAEHPDYQVVGVYTHPPKPMGRGHHLTPSPIHKVAKAFGIPVFTPLSLKPLEEQHTLQGLNPDVVVVAAYGLILPQNILDIPPKGCVNLHASLLPRWRGASPIQQALLAGDSHSGLSIMHMEAGLDTGPTYAIYPIPLAPDETSQTLHDKIAVLGARHLPPLLGQLPLCPTPQPLEGVTYAPKVTRQDAQLMWDQPAIVLDRAIRAFSPSPKAWTTWQGQILKIGKAQVSSSAPHQEKPGTLLDAALQVACGDGSVLQILELQKADGRMMPASAFMCGTPLEVGHAFGDCS